MVRALGQDFLKEWAILLSRDFLDGEEAQGRRSSHTTDLGDSVTHRTLLLVFLCFILRSVPLESAASLVVTGGGVDMVEVPQTRQKGITDSGRISPRHGEGGIA